MGCRGEKLSKYLTQSLRVHCNAMICQQVTLPGDAEWPKVADAVIEALNLFDQAEQARQFRADALSRTEPTERRTQV